MATICDAVVKIVRDYPVAEHLSNARVTKLLYLADWHHVLRYSAQISSIRWYFDNYGPYVPDVRQAVEASPWLFDICETANAFGNRKTVFRIGSTDYCPQIEETEETSLNHVMKVTRELSWNEFIRLVYSTYPIASSSRYSYLDLSQKAEEYRELKAQRESGG